jgi:chromosome segregation ATPase
MEIIDALEQKYGCRTQQLISMLICDYADIEARYKRDQLANTKGMVQLQSQTQELKATVAVLEEQLKETESNYPFTPSSTFLVQRIHQLERENKILQESNQELKEKARQADESKEQVLQEKQQEIEILTLEKDSEAMLALAIQDRLDQENPHNSAESSAVHLKLTKRIQEQNKDVARLQNEVQGKNERIAALRSEAINHQIRSFPTYCEDTGSFSKTADDDRSGDTADNSDLGLSQDAQFQDMQHLVRKKEEELNAERKRFAAREVELMAMVRESHPEISSGVADLRFFL